MKKRWFFVSLTVTLWLLTPFQVHAQEDLAAPQPPWFSLWEKAKAFEKKGSYLEARGVYESLLGDKTLGDHAPRVRKAFEALNLKILFSPLATSDSLFHEVVPGDTLSGIAKKYGTTIELLQKSNHIKGEKIYVGKKIKVSQARFSILVRKRRNTLTLLANGKPVKIYRVATGEKGSTPVGTFHVVNKLKNPTWFHAGLVLPPDSPDNILGTRWIGFDRPGYGVHGTTLPNTIGTQSSKGCVRMLNKDVEELYDILPLGTRVLVRE